jgi:hypothetical protein
MNLLLVCIWCVVTVLSRMYTNTHSHTHIHTTLKVYRVEII